MKRESFKINIDLPRYPKGTIVYHEYETLPSKYGVNQTYSANHNWFTLDKTWDNKEQKVGIWSWIIGLIETCDNMSSHDPIAKKLITRMS